MLHLSKSEDYAVILIHELAKSWNEKPVPLSKIAKSYDISLLFLRNLATVLRRHDLIEAVEGKKGGYFLKKDPEKLLIGEILHVFSPKPFLPCCEIGHKKGFCEKASFCAPGKIWRQLNQDFLSKISKMSVREFMLIKT